MNGEMAEWSEALDRGSNHKLSPNELHLFHGLVAPVQRFFNSRLGNKKMQIRFKYSCKPVILHSQGLPDF